MEKLSREFVFLFNYWNKYEGALNTHINLFKIWQAWVYTKIGS